MSETNPETKQLYVVTFVMDMVVAASSKEEAEIIARRNQSLEAANLDIECVEEMSHLPGQWELDALVYGKPERTVDEWIEAGAAPKYAEVRDKLKAAFARSKGTVACSSPPVAPRR